jgi:hypothetical protein
MLDSFILSPLEATYLTFRAKILDKVRNDWHCTKPLTIVYLDVYS